MAINKCIVSISFSFPVFRPSYPEMHFPGVLSLLTPRAPEPLPKLNAFSFHASAKSLLLPAQPISSQATQKQLQQRKSPTVIIILPRGAPAGCALGRQMGLGGVEKSPGTCCRWGARRVPLRMGFGCTGQWEALNRALPASRGSSWCSDSCGAARNNIHRCGGDRAPGWGPLPGQGLCLSHSA